MTSTFATTRPDDAHVLRYRLTEALRRITRRRPTLDAHRATRQLARAHLLRPQSRLQFSPRRTPPL